MQVMNNYISVSLSVTEKHGLIASAIYGLIWSREKLSKGYCYESYRSIGKLVGCSTRTVSRNVSTLIKAGLIRDVTGFHSIEVKRLGIAKRLQTIPSALEVIETEYKDKQTKVRES